MKKNKKRLKSSPAISPLGKNSTDIITQNTKKIKQQEVWVDIRGFEREYQISNLGNIRRVRELKQSKTKLGYRYVQLHNEYYYIHRLVAEHFLNKNKGQEEVNHKDGNPSNNNVENLEWCTHQYNVKYSYDKLNRKHIGIKGFENNLSKSVCQFDLKGNLIKIWGSQTEVERELGIGRTNIYNACSGKTKNHISQGYIWRYTCEVIIC